MLMFVAILSGYTLALVAPGLVRIARRQSGWILALVPGVSTILFASLVGAVSSGESLEAGIPWVPELGINLTVRLDGLSLLFVLLIQGIGTFILIYANSYLADHPELGRLHVCLLLFMSSMLGLVLADNILLLFVFWELTSITSYLLIGFDHQRERARSAALQALLVTGAGGLALLAGLLLLGQACGSMELSRIVAEVQRDPHHPLIAPALILILLGAFTKSAQFPFHFWLPSAMEAPTPISAYLHSATMVKAGVYLLARLSPALGSQEIWTTVVPAVGLVTSLVGGWLALTQSDLKRILAYSTVSALGKLTLLLGIGGATAIPATMVFLLCHALYKGALFLVAGIVDHEAGTRNVDQLRGLTRAMPITALAAILAGCSMAGLPPLLGFIAKDLMYEGTLRAQPALGMTVAAVLTNMALVAVALIVGMRPFVGRALTTPRPAHEASLGLWLGPIVLALLGAIIGIAPGFGAEQLLTAASTAVLGNPVPADLSLWHGWTPALGLGTATLLGGLAVFRLRSYFRQIVETLPLLERWSASTLHDRMLSGLYQFAKWETGLLQNGSLMSYLRIILATMLALTGWALLDGRPTLHLRDLRDVHFYEAGLVVLILLAILAAVLFESRLAAIAALGAVGYGVATIFVLFGAPDVAMTQFLVETLTVILFVLVFYHVPKTKVPVKAVSRLRDTLFALGVGTLMTVLVLYATEVQYHPSISSYYLEHSLAEAHGRNVVNVILVDFRALDTLGEIAVLSVAGIGVFALVKLRLGLTVANAANRPSESDAVPGEGGDKS